MTPAGTATTQGIDATIARVTGELRTTDDDAPPRCAFCSRDAAGPCAGCRRMVCGDCCTLTEGGAKTWAVCLECDRKKGRSLRGAWGGFGLWMLALLVGLAVLLAALHAIWPNR